MSLDLNGLGVLAEPRRPAEPYRAQRSAFSWLLERELRRFLNIWQYSILGPVLSTLLFVVVFGTALGGHIDQLQGVSYGRFIVPGLVTLSVVDVGFYNGTTSLYEARRDRYINDVFVSPLRWWEIEGALVLGAMIRGVITAIAVLAVAVPLTGTSVARPAYLLVASLGILVAAAQAGVIAGSLAKSLDHVYSMESIVLLPLGFLSGVFYSVAALPDHWAQVSHVNPAFWLVQSARIGFLGEGDVAGWSALGSVWLLAAGLTLWSTRIFATGARLKP